MGILSRKMAMQGASKENPQSSGQEQIKHLLQRPPKMNASHVTERDVSIIKPLL
jgi:hypothetical protein